jgi:hypothetical protein
LEFNFFFIFFYVSFQSTTKEAFVANAIRLALEHHEIFIHHHATKAIEAAAKYYTNMGIDSSSYLEK